LVNTKTEVVTADMVAAAQELRMSEYGAHFLIVYHDLTTFREMYSQYVKTALKENEIVLILPFYETVNAVRQTLSGDSACIDVRKSEKEQSLLIIDSLIAYFGTLEGLLPFVNKMVEFANTSGRNGVSVIGDMGAFFYYEKYGGLLDYETTTLPTKFEGVNLKGFCAYHKQDFNNKLSEKQKRMLLEHHGRAIYLSPFF
jgi:MEDS: MEthanogen/methylotroph, DcmR Sensory domain